MGRWRSNVVCCLTEKYTIVNLETRSSIIGKELWPNVRKVGLETIVTPVLPTLNLLENAMLASKVGLDLHVMVVPLDGVELTVMSVMSTLDLLDFVTVAWLDGLETTAVIVTGGGLDLIVMSVLPTLSLLGTAADVRLDGPETTVLNVTRAGLVITVTCARDSDSAKRVTALNASRMDTGQEVMALMILMSIWRSLETPAPTWFLVGFYKCSIVILLMIMVDPSYFCYGLWDCLLMKVSVAHYQLRDMCNLRSVHDN